MDLFTKSKEEIGNRIQTKIHKILGYENFLTHRLKLTKKHEINSTDIKRESSKMGMEIIRSDRPGTTKRLEI